MLEVRPLKDGESCYCAKDAKVAPAHENGLRQAYQSGARLMPDAIPNPTPVPSDLAWRVIGLTNLYRLLLPPVLLILQVLASPGVLARAADPELFRIVCYLYLVVG